MYFNTAIFFSQFLIIHIVASCLLSIFLLKRMTVFSTYFPYLFLEIIVKEKHISCMYIMYCKLIRYTAFLEVMRNWINSRAQSLIFQMSWIITNHSLLLIGRVFKAWLKIINIHWYSTFPLNEYDLTYA